MGADATAPGSDGALCARAGEILASTAFQRRNPAMRNPNQVATSAAAASTTIRRSKPVSRQNPLHFSATDFNPSPQRKSRSRLGPGWVSRRAGPTQDV